MKSTFALAFGLLFAAAPPATRAADAPSTRDLSDINWMELKEVVPSKIDTVILPTGTLEPHGVINNGADLTAPIAIARKIAPEVNAMVAPIIPYGMTGAMDAYPGSFSISEAAYRSYVHDVLAGLGPGPTSISPKSSRRSRRW